MGRILRNRTSNSATGAKLMASRPIRVCAILFVGALLVAYAAWEKRAPSGAVEREKVVLKRVLEFRVANGSFPQGLSEVAGAEDVGRVSYLTDGRHFLLAPRTQECPELPVTLLRDTISAFEEGGAEGAVRVVIDSGASKCRWVTSDLFVPKDVDMPYLTLRRDQMIAGQK